MNSAFEFLQPAVEPDAGKEGLTSALARFVAGAHEADLPPEAADGAAKALADTVGCILAGSRSEVAAPLLDYLATSGARGDALVLGRNLTAPPELAALVNGTFAHALDFDDVLSIMPAHPSAAVLPAMLARLGVEPVSGRRFLHAYVVGIEVGARIGLAIGHGHYRRGWHATGTLAVFSAIGALARLQELNAGQIAAAFGLGASMASGLQRNFGTMAKPLHAGLAARNAVAAVQLAKAGLSASPDALDGPDGFLAVYGTDYSNAARGLRTAETPLAVVDPGLSLKKYPCCYALHRPIEAIRQLSRQLELTAENTRSVSIRLAPETIRPLRDLPPSSGLEAKFSVEYVLAANICDGRIGLSSFTDAAVGREHVRALMSRVERISDPACVGQDGAAMSKSAGTVGYVEATATRLDGASATVRVYKAPGSRSQPLAWAEIGEKFLDCAASGGIDKAAAERAFDGWKNLASANDVGALVGTIGANP